ncbi:MAG: histidine kinase dimerization/phospho-acceptor domain-containing protein, partial [Verrucomicrobiales bacterium]|nr:histidine kinase dimerization/phospho-acceptor domain-containing protein [Verrucomicrobiales bacterium]
MSSARPTSKVGSETALHLASLLQRLLTPEGLLLDGQLRVVDATEGARRWLGLDKDGSRARLPSPIRALARAALRSATGGEVQRATFELPGNSGVRLQASAWPCPGRRASKGVMLLLQEVSGAERIERSLGQVQRLSSLGLLTASLAHELKNALVPVKTFVDLAIETGRVPELADDARRELRRINALVEQVLRFSRTGRHVSAPVHVHQVLEEALRLVQRRLDERLIRLERRMEAAHDLVEGDAVQLQQAFLNLLLNALEAM